MREKQIPVDSVEIKETIQAFAWEPVGSKFAVIHGESPTTSVSFYEVKTGQTPTLVKKYERKPCNQLYWAPSGQFIVLAGLRAMSGTLEFIDTQDFTIMNTGEHFMATDVEWDPTGRYVATAVSWWGHKVRKRTRPVQPLKFKYSSLLINRWIMLIGCGRSKEEF